MLSSSTSSSQVAVIYYSRSGRLVTLANVIAEGVRQVRPRNVHAPRPRHGEANIFVARMLVPTGTCCFSSDSIVSSPPRHALD